MEPNLQRRVQRYGWDRAAHEYEDLWHAQLACVHSHSLQIAALKEGQHVLDVACGTGLVALRAAQMVGTTGRVLGVDISGQMVDTARQQSKDQNISNVSFARMDAERLQLPDCSFDVALCPLGLMYVPEPERALREMQRVLRPGGRSVVAVWGERHLCGWAALFSIVADEVASDVCPLFFSLGQHDTLARLCADAHFADIQQHRLVTTLSYSDADEACRAAFLGGPVALAWSRFTEDARARVCARYVDAIEPWRRGRGYEIPGEFVVVAGART